MAFRFIHTADIHLDSPLKSLGVRNEELQSVISNATRKVLVRIIDLCLAEKVDALLIAGDLYDGNQTSMKTANLLASQLRRLDAANISAFIIRGNHDAESKITRELSFPDKVHVFSSKCESIILDVTKPNFNKPVVIHGVSFKKPHAPESLLPQYKQPVPDAINIGMMHTSLDGASGHDLYAPCSLSDLQNHGFDYWALGHIHKRAEHENNNAHIVMPGIPQGRDIGEAGQKSVTLVSINEDNQVVTDEKQLAVAQYELVQVELNNSHDWYSTIEIAIDSISHASNQSSADLLVARVVLEGTTELSWRLHRDEDLFLQELESRLDDDEHLWIDKLIINCAMPLGSASDDLLGPHAEFSELIQQEITQSKEFESNATMAVEEIVGVLPPELRAQFGDNEIERAKLIKELATQGSHQVLANLYSDNSSEDKN